MTTEQAILLGGALIVVAIAVIAFTVFWDMKKKNENPEAQTEEADENKADESADE